MQSEEVNFANGQMTWDVSCRSPSFDLLLCFVLHWPNRGGVKVTVSFCCRCANENKIGIFMTRNVVRSSRIVESNNWDDGLSNERSQRGCKREIGGRSWSLVSGGRTDRHVNECNSRHKSQSVRDDGEAKQPHNIWTCTVNGSIHFRLRVFWFCPDRRDSSSLSGMHLFSPFPKLF